MDTTHAPTPPTPGISSIPQVDPAIAATLADDTMGPAHARMALAQQYGPIYQMPGTGPRVVTLANFALSNEVCDDQRFDKSLRNGLDHLRAVMGDGLFTAYTQEPNWRKAHSILLPAFSVQAMKGYMPQMLDLAGQLMLKWERLNPGDAIDVPDDMTRLTLDTIGLCGFGYRFNSFYRTEQHPFIQAMMQVLHRMQERVLSALPADQAAQDPQMQQPGAMMNALVDTVIQRRKAESPEEIAATHDLLSYMLTGAERKTGERLDDETIRYEIVTFMLAGHETTSGTLAFALYFLLKHPDVTARAYAEVDRVLGTDLSAQPSYEQVHQLTYVSQIIKESLRLYPPVPSFARSAYQATTLGGHYAVTPDDLINVQTMMVHRDPAVWGADAEEFNPDHFSPEAEQARPANAFLPFGTGQRACIGRQFALQEATLGLGMLLQRFAFIDHAQYQLQIKQAGTLKPDHFTITVRPRNTTAQMAPGLAPTSAAVSAHPAPTAVTATTVGHNTPLLILFGSNLGTAEDLAQRVANGATSRGFATTVAPLDDYTNKLPTQGAVVIITASYNGTAPDNATAFCAWLRDDALNGHGLAAVHYAVFGCGNHEWRATFQAVPRMVDDKLAAHGAQRVQPLGEGDVAGDFEGQFDAWETALWSSLATTFSLDVVPETTAAVAPGHLYAVERVSVPANPLLTANGVQPLAVTVNRELQTHNGDSSGSTRHIEVKLPAGMRYHTGDHLGVMPRNAEALVKRVLARFGFAGDAYVRIRRNGAGTPVFPLDQPVPIIELLSHYLELQEVAARAQIQTLAAYTDCPPDKAALLALAEEARYQHEVLEKRITVLDLLERYPACALPFSVYLEMLHPLRVRYYSISSSPLVAEQVCSITPVVVKAPARSGAGTYEGICSTYLARHPENSIIAGFVHKPHMAFRPPDDATIPLIMVGPGTGVAPFRGFLQERVVFANQGQQLGPALLFFGCRQAHHDDIYRDEMEAFAAQGVVTVHTAYSRMAGQPKTYVQDVITAHADEVWQMIANGAIIYVCGDAGAMEPAVRQAFQRIYATKTGATAAEATAWQQDLTDNQRYLADVWARG